jgi:outer membrane biosynthesis protein TonB
MGIIDKLKKQKKSQSVLDALMKEKEPKEEIKEKPSDMEVREITDTRARMPGEKTEDSEAVKETQVREFRTEGMHEFDIETLGTNADAGLKAEYKAKIIKLIDEDKIEEAIKLLEELHLKLL